MLSRLSKTALFRLCIICLAIALLPGCAIVRSPQDAADTVSRGTRDIAYKATGSDWLIYHRDSYFVYSFNPQSIQHPTSQYTRVWTKKALRSEEGREQWIADQKKAGTFGPGFEDYKYTLAHYEVDCPNRIIRVMSSADYGSTGELRAESNARTRWHTIVAGTREHRLHDALCP